MKPPLFGLVRAGTIRSGWFRVFGFGLSWTQEPPLLSERTGERKRLKAFGWRWSILTPWR